MAEAWGARLRYIAASLEATCRETRGGEPACGLHRQEAADLSRLADLLERITPAMRHEVATLGGSLPRQATMRALRNILIDLAAGPQGEEGRGHA